MDEDDERSAYYNSVQDPSADDSVSLLSFSVFSSFKGLLSFFLVTYHVFTDSSHFICHFTA